MTEPSGGGPAHPRGTLAILAVYGLVFGAAWLALYFLEFLSRGAPTR